MSSLPSFGNSRMSLFLQLATLFRNRIVVGEWPVGSRIPNVAELAEEFSVARGTIREALGMLEEEGLINRFRAKGSFVRRSPTGGTHQLASNWAALITAHQEADIEVIEHSRVSQLPPSAAELGAPVAEYEYLRRLHSRNGSPFLVGRLYLAVDLYQLAPPERFRHEPTVRILHEVAGDRIAGARQILTIGIADSDSAALLGLPVHAPIAHVERHALDPEGRVIYFSQGVYRGDAVRLEIDFR